MATKLTVTKIPKLNTLVIKQLEGHDFFRSSADVIVIPVSSLSFILKFLVDNNFVSHRVLEGILEEYNSLKGDF